MFNELNYTDLFYVQWTVDNTTMSYLGYLGCIREWQDAYLKKNGYTGVGIEFSSDRPILQRVQYKNAKAFDGSEAVWQVRSKKTAVGLTNIRKDTIVRRATPSEETEYSIVALLET